MSDVIHVVIVDLSKAPLRLHSEDSSARHSDRVNVIAAELQTRNAPYTFDEDARRSLMACSAQTPFSRNESPLETQMRHAPSTMWQR